MIQVGVVSQRGWLRCVRQARLCTKLALPTQSVKQGLDVRTAASRSDKLFRQSADWRNAL